LAVKNYYLFKTKKKEKLILMSITEDGFSVLTLIPPPKEKNNSKKRGTWGLRYGSIKLFS